MGDDAKVPCVTCDGEHEVSAHLRPKDALLAHVIYDHPDDRPDHWVVRSWAIQDGEQKPAKRSEWFNELWAAQAWIRQEYPGAVLVQPEGVDEDPKVYEVWM